ncbi:MAG: 5-(carboxyamino)imidazole ribonucleotide synthase [Pseudomonadota bacterium]
MGEQRPFQTIGIIGGGQLGRMLALAAARLGHKTIVLDPAENCPAAQVCNGHIIAAYDDTSALYELSTCDVVTFEFENVDLEAIRALQKRSHVAPNPGALEISQDRLTEKRFLKDAGLTTVAFENIEDAIQLEKALGAFDGKGILKTRRFGYDGKGQISFKGRSDDPTPANALDQIAYAPAILEAFVPFTSEISVIITRGTDGESVCFDPAGNVHMDGILHTSTVPAAVPHLTLQNAQAHAERVAQALNYVGTLGLEFFVLNDGTLIANEFAPRVHNSGHWTEAACTIDQFEMHIRAITGWPLPQPVRHSNAVMENLIGNDIAKLATLAELGEAKLHDYGKSEARPGRKMGHVTRLTPKNIG